MNALAGLQLAVVGHTEWVEFVRVPHLPRPGEILHADGLLEQPAGGGAVTAVQMARLAGGARFFTALGRDSLGRRALSELQALGLQVEVVWRDQPTRRAITYVDGHGERSITVIGQRLNPVADDPLPWEQLQDCDGVFLTATDADGIRQARQAAVLTATPRLGLTTLEHSGIQLDALIGSGLDPGEQVPDGLLSQEPKLRIATEGSRGGWSEPGGRFATAQRGRPLGDTYGAGDSFAGGVTAGLAAGWSRERAIDLGCRCGASCIDGIGPYANQLKG
jgi:ribokinase